MFFSIIFIILDGYQINLHPYNVAIVLFSSLLWMAGVILGFSSYLKNGVFSTLSFIMCIIAAFFLALLSPATISTLPASNQPASGSGVFNEITTIIILLSIPFFPYYIGASLASVSISEKFLSRIQKIVLTIPFEITGMVSLKAKASKNNTKASKVEIFTYVAREGSPIYLVATFSKSTAIYLTKELTGEERGKLVVLANEVIRALEIRSGHIESNQ